MTNKNQGKSVSIRPIKITDTSYIVEWRNNPRVRHNFIFRETFTEKMHINWFNTKVETGEVAQFIIEADNIPVGSTYLRDIDRINNSAEFGIFIGNDSFIGCGIGKEATKLLLSYAFEKMELHRVFLRVLSYNKRAIATYEHCGFSLEGVAKDMVLLDNQYHDVIFMSAINAKRV